jgi:hypothetical protein
MGFLKTHLQQVLPEELQAIAVDAQGCPGMGLKLFTVNLIRELAPPDAAKLRRLTKSYAARARATFFRATPSASKDFTSKSIETDESAASIFATRD